jgi:hypothetical protein
VIFPWLFLGEALRQVQTLQNFVCAVEQVALVHLESVILDAFVEQFQVLKSVQ